MSHKRIPSERTPADDIDVAVHVKKVPHLAAACSSSASLLDLPDDVIGLLFRLLVDESDWVSLQCTCQRLLALGLSERRCAVFTAQTQRAVFWRALERTTSVRKVAIKRCTDFDPSWITDCPAVSGATELILTRLNGFSDAAMAHVPRVFPAVEMLTLSALQSLSSVGLQSLARLRGLRCLTVDRCDWSRIDDSLVCELLRALPQLEVLDLDPVSGPLTAAAVPLTADSAASRSCSSSPAAAGAAGAGDDGGDCPAAAAAAAAAAAVLPFTRPLHTFRARQLDARSAPFLRALATLCPRLAVLDCPKLSLDDPAVGDALRALPLRQLPSDIGVTTAHLLTWPTLEHVALSRSGEGEAAQRLDSLRRLGALPALRSLRLSGGVQSVPMGLEHLRVLHVRGPLTLDSPAALAALAPQLDELVLDLLLLRSLPPQPLPLHRARTVVLRRLLVAERGAPGALPRPALASVPAAQVLTVPSTPCLQLVLPPPQTAPLRRLCFSPNNDGSQITDREVLPLLRCCAPGVLSELALPTNLLLSPPLLQALLPLMPGLTEIGLGGMLGSSEDFATLLRAARRLRKLDAGWCSGLRDAALLALAQSCRTLEELSVMHTAVTDAGVVACAAASPRLRVFRFSGRDPDDRDAVLTDAALRALAAHCPRLEHVAVDGSRPITDAAVQQLAQRCRNLQSASFDHCPFVTRRSADALQMYCPFLTRVYVVGRQLDSHAQALRVPTPSDTMSCASSCSTQD